MKSYTVIMKDEGGNLGPVWHGQAKGEMDAKKQAFEAHDYKWDDCDVVCYDRDDTVDAPSMNAFRKLRKDHQALVKRQKALETAFYHFIKDVANSNGDADGISWAAEKHNQEGLEVATVGYLQKGDE